MKTRNLFLSLLILSAIAQISCEGYTSRTYRVTNNTSWEIKVKATVVKSGEDIERSVPPGISGIILYDESRGGARGKSDPSGKINIKLIVNSKNDTCKKKLDKADSWNFKLESEKNYPPAYHQEYTVDINPDDFR